MALRLVPPPTETEGEPVDTSEFAEARRLAIRLGANLDGSEDLRLLHLAVIIRAIPDAMPLFEDGTLPIAAEAIAAMYQLARLVAEARKTNR